MSEPVAQAIARHVKQGMVAFDIGANRGHMTRAMVEAGASVVAFEPLDDCALEIEALGLPGVRVVRTAVSDSAGTSAFHVDARPGLDGQGSSLREMTVGHTIAVPVTTIDDFVQQTGVAPHFIKIDVEGVEEKVIEGGMDTILRHKPVIVFEVWGYNWPRFERVIRILSTFYLFRCASDGSDALERYKDVVETNDDVICVPRDLSDKEAGNMIQRG